VAEAFLNNKKYYLLLKFNIVLNNLELTLFFIHNTTLCDYENQKTLGSPSVSSWKFSTCKIISEEKEMEVVWYATCFVCVRSGAACPTNFKGLRAVIASVLRSRYA